VSYFRSIAVLVVTGALLLTNAACNRQETRTRKVVKSDAERKLAPDFTLKDANGRTVTLSEYKGKVVLLNFWATWCGPCKIEIPWFMDFEQQYKDRGFAVLGVSMDEEGWEAVKPYVEEKRINYRVALGNDSVGDLYGGIESLPTTFVIDRDGRVAAAHKGLISKSDYQNEILQLLDSKADRGGDVHAAAGAN
jgi:cytochrome c biogenesis protein CcmG/thiol:disulfide interchange protein DsbE